MENGPLAAGTSIPKAGKRIRTDLKVPNRKTNSLSRGFGVI